MVTYAQRTDLELLFGKENIQGWADINNDGANFDAAERIAWALSMSQAELEDKLRYGPYSLPFTSPAPRMIVYTHSLMAGVLLYETRGVTDADEGKHQLQWHRKKADAIIRDILSRRIRLSVKSQATDFPQSTKIDTTPTDGVFTFE